MKNTTTFENAKVNDKIWSIEYRRWFTITRIHNNCITISDDDFTTYCNFDGSRYNTNDKFQSYFWDEIEIIAPVKPLPKLKVDTKVIVWNDNTSRKHNAYFSHFNDKGRICTFIDGRTSWSTGGSYIPSWDFWELAEED